MSPDTLPVLDPAVLKQLVALDGGGKGLLKEMAQLFREDIGGRLVAIEAALAAGNPEGIAQEAHAIKGAAGAVGARRLQNLTQEIERGARAGSLGSAADERIASLKPAFEEAAVALEEEAKG
ncbi:MAG TPA: Hpt domain-containing protein [Holophagaceae bacterium]|jgi:HPt (histidine-containing phosphotransfer) domain-containing protein|nr:Hpt domain-containing protein [Holophagaceae bacterium]